MRLIIAGGRDYTLSPTDLAILDLIQSSVSPITVISGHATGADAAGEAWAVANGFTVEVYPADWSLGKKAGPLRNGVMAERADAAILFPGGRGTENMRQHMERLGKPCLCIPATTEAFGDFMRKLHIATSPITITIQHG